MTHYFGCVSFGSLRYILQGSRTETGVRVTALLDEAVVIRSLQEIENRAIDSQFAESQLDDLDPFSSLEKLADESILIPLSLELSMTEAEPIVIAEATRQLRARIDVLRLAYSNILWHLEGPVSIEP